MAEEHEVNLYRLQAINTLIAEKQKIPPGALMDAIDIAISDMQMIEELQAREEKIMAYVKKLDEDYKRVMIAVGSITGKVDDILSKADLANTQNQQVQETPVEPVEEIKEEKPKKKRGRPKKETTEKTESKEEVKPKKRGRPKKVTE